MGVSSVRLVDLLARGSGRLGENGGFGSLLRGQVGEFGDDFVFAGVVGEGIGRLFGLRGGWFRGLRGLLRFEANFGLFPFFLGLYEVVVGLVEGALGGDVVADEEAEVFGKAVFAADGLAGEGFALETEGAEGEPLVGGHFFDENLLGDGGGLVFGGEVVEESYEFLRIFAGHDGGTGGEAVGEAVAGGDGFAFGRFGSGGLLGILLIGLHLADCCHEIAPFDGVGCGLTP